LGTTVELKKPTAYRLLNKMAEDGWVTYREEQEGNRPPRRVFAISPEGEAAFQRLLRECLADYQPIVFPGNIGLLFLPGIPPQEALDLLQKRRGTVKAVLETVSSHPGHDEGSEYVLMHQKRHLLIELDWLDELMARIAGEGRGA
jgi:DNA-binding PadR family transcriptional regulator